MQYTKFKELEENEIKDSYKPALSRTGCFI